ncbi:amidase [Colletotrichum orchidophilum]|uniref:Amidase n=1 Tax=Colletotrichum orchidophilum TaxID=1209926 RepID=A0A1G4BFG9_9PEZI|nr:amidase [Colletotrichum orchidophilum]OHF00182.1 amidase [Colletotrichum orchidophilum]
MPAAMEWEAIASRHRSKQQHNIPQEWKISDDELNKLRGKETTQEGRLIARDVAQKSTLLNDRELDITGRYNARQLLHKIHQGDLTSEEVTVAFCKRAALAQQLDSYIVKGHYATVGYVEFLKRPLPTSNSAMVNLLLDAGAVLFCKTNVPQTMMTADSENNIFGRTLNPHKTNLTAGGSTGGEGALVAFRGSVLGVGTDIAGSIRIPSLCCGIYGFKPTADRTPFGGQAYYPFRKLRLPGVTPVAGPMANSVDDLTLFMETVLARRPWCYDASVVSGPWRNSERSNKTLTIGVLPEDPDYPLHPPVRRALEDAVANLTSAGHKVIRLPATPACSASLGGKIGFHYFGLGSSGLDALASEIGEPLVHSVSRGVHPFTSSKPLIPRELDTVHQLDEFLGLQASYANSWKDVWIEHRLDVVIGPGAISTAVPHDTYGTPVYTLMWNVLDYPAGIIPFGVSSKEKDPHYQKAISDFDADYDPEESDGAPCSIQVIAPRFHDEECLEAMRIIDRDIRA